MVWCDGRRSADLRAGLQIEVQQGRHRLLLARLSEAPFTDRLVNKFGLRVEGWRGEAEERTSREDRNVSLGAGENPDDSEDDPGPDPDESDGHVGELDRASGG